MPSGVAVPPPSVTFVVYKEILDGDRRKLEAQSNDSDSGGGARDLRFPFDDFKPAFEKLFPISKIEKRRRGGKPVPVTIFHGKFYWGGGNEDASFEPPTDARAGEGRIPVIHKYPCLKKIPNANEGTVFLLLILHDNGEVWPHYATKESLEKDNWYPEVKDAILSCFSAIRPAGRATMGYIDFISGRVYCNGR